MSLYAQIADLNRNLHIISHLEKDSFFGRLEILDYYCGLTHSELGKPWYKFGRWMNVCEPEAFMKALRLLKEEVGLTADEAWELYEWLDRDGKSYGNPDELVGAVMMYHEIPRVWDWA